MNAPADHAELGTSPANFELPPEIVERIASGTPEQVSNWGLRVLIARSLEDVFAS